MDHHGDGKSIPSEGGTANEGRGKSSGGELNQSQGGNYILQRWQRHGSRGGVVVERDESVCTAS